MTLPATLLFIILWLFGLVATFIPVLPSSFIIWGAGLVYALLTNFAEINAWWLVGLGLVAVGSSLLDNLAGAWGARKYGGSRAATIGALIGGIVGIFLGPLGILIGPLGGAFVGEFFFGARATRVYESESTMVMEQTPATSLTPAELETRSRRALSSTKGTLLGLVLGVGAKLVVHFFMGLAVLVRIAF